MNADQFKGKWVQFKGELKKQWGRFTDDDLKQIEGDYDKFIGKLQERYGDRRNEVSKWAEEWYQRPAEFSSTDETREGEGRRWVQFYSY
jgi:uncharacterized protein YjbJ (UPF0337 family)